MGAVPQIPTKKGSGYVACIQTPQKCLPSKHVLKEKARSSGENCFSEKKNSGRAHAQHKLALVQDSRDKGQGKDSLHSPAHPPSHTALQKGSFALMITPAPPKATGTALLPLNPARIQQTKGSNEPCGALGMSNAGRAGWAGNNHPAPPAAFG